MRLHTVMFLTFGIRPFGRVLSPGRQWAPYCAYQMVLEPESLGYRTLRIVRCILHPSGAGIRVFEDQHQLEELNGRWKETVDEVLSSAGVLDGRHYSFGGRSLQITERCLSGILCDAVGVLQRARAKRYTTRGNKRNHLCRQHGLVGPAGRGTRKSDVGGSCS